ncbi:MAG: hypothetical protein K2K48_04575 [Anaeroplasmataceae bacterium]|nr:hypothetical protein [Anaeroplasmataceae bacterium]MDE6414668.1 hypothetical protein [Anaeroplasmataceae bacterium]
MQKKNNRMLLAFRIIIVIAFIFVVTCTILYFMEVGQPEKSYFSKHFALPIILFFVGVIAIMLSILSKKSMSGENKGDTMMIGVGVLLFLCAILTLIFSYVM